MVEREEGRIFVAGNKLMGAKVSGMVEMEISASVRVRMVVEAFVESSGDDFLLLAGFDRTAPVEITERGRIDPLCEGETDSFLPPAVVVLLVALPEALDPAEDDSALTGEISPNKLAFRFNSIHVKLISLILFESMDSNEPFLAELDLFRPETTTGASSSSISSTSTTRRSDSLSLLIESNIHHVSESLIPIKIETNLFSSSQLHYFPSPFLIL